MRRKDSKIMRARIFNDLPFTFSELMVEIKRRKEKHDVEVQKILTKPKK